MLKTGKEYLAGLKDSRVVFIGAERVSDVTEHPAFRNAARSIAAIYDMKAAAENKDLMTFEADGAQHSLYFLRARSREDLERRMVAHKRIADMSFGLFGRSPDYFASFITGMAIDPSIFGKFGDNLAQYYKFMRDHDIFAAHAVVPPQASRDHSSYHKRQNHAKPGLSVVSESDEGLVVSGMKMLATGAILADEIWVGNLLPLAQDNKSEAITFAIPCNAPGLSLWSRKPLERYAISEFDSPLTWRFDETDSVVIFDNVMIPWERVFVYENPSLAQEIYIRTPAHVYGNHQSNVRFLAKLQFITGLASRISQCNDCDEIPVVREKLGRLASMEAALGGMIFGQIQAFEQWPDGYVSCNRRIMYAAMNWCSENYSGLIDCLRELCGSGVLQMPADVSVLNSSELSEIFQSYWYSPRMEAVDRMKLFKLAWDIIGSEFAGRHLQYEKFYAGAAFIQLRHSFREAPWEEFHQIIDSALVQEPPKPD